MHCKLDIAILTTALEQSNDGVIITDYSQKDHPIIYVNPAFETLTGYSADDILGKNCRFLQGDSQDQKAIAVLNAAIKRGESCRVELKNHRKDGSVFWNELSISPVSVNARGVTHFIGIQKDISERKTFEFLLEKATFHDAMTGIYNRRGFFSHVVDYVPPKRDAHLLRLLISVDIDRLKAINDSCGYAAGDEVIKLAAKLLMEVFGDKTDVVGRTGGDEFIVLSLAPDVGVVHDKLVKLTELIQDANKNLTTKWELSLSAGAATYSPDKHKNVDQLIAEADGAMYREKSDKYRSRML